MRAGLPGPGQYAVPASVGPQPVSTRPGTPCVGFPRAHRDASSKVRSSIIYHASPLHCNFPALNAAVSSEISPAMCTKQCSRLWGHRSRLIRSNVVTSYDVTLISTPPSMLKAVSCFDRLCASHRCSSRLRMTSTSMATAPPAPALQLLLAALASQSCQVTGDTHHSPWCVAH